MYANCSVSNDFKFQHHEHTEWAFATASHASPATCDAIADVAILRLTEFTSQDLANTVGALASAGHASPSFFDAIAKAKT